MLECGPDSLHLNTNINPIDYSITVTCSYTQIDYDCTPNFVSLKGWGSDELEIVLMHSVTPSFLVHLTS